jgi:hypothetical protein
MSNNSFEDSTEEILEDDLADRLGKARSEISSIRKVLEVCESPIERMFLAQWAKRAEMVAKEGFRLDEALPEWYGRRHLAEFRIALPALERFNIRVYPQVNLQPKGSLKDRSWEEEEGKYRVDVLAIVERREGESTNIHGMETEIYAKLVIELDGHDYHERTKEQAKRDRSRDRAFTKSGYQVLRFTGSEVYNRTRECVDEANRYLVDRAEEVVKEEGF